MSLKKRKEPPKIELKILIQQEPEMRKAMLSRNLDRLHGNYPSKIIDAEHRTETGTRTIDRSVKATKQQQGALIWLTNRSGPK